MTYSQTLDFLYSQLPAYHRIGKAAYKNDLINTTFLDDYLGRPHLRFPSVHIAGTNGKGSVSHMLASVFQEAGYKTGLYTSPHLRDFRERIRINGRMISENEVILFVQDHKSVIESIRPSFFEMTVAMAFNYFAANSVEVAVVEVGLGGRLDSTNIIIPVLSLITNIGHDHMDLLGDTLEKIAIEKAGIIKKSIPALISETQAETEQVFRRIAQEQGSEVLFADSLYECGFHKTSGRDEGRPYSLTEKKSGQTFKGISVLQGDYQQKNIQAVYAACSILKKIFKLSTDHINSGIRNVIINTGLEGRWQVIGASPLTICDTGHNKEGLEYVIEQLMKMKSSELHIIVGFVNDKDLNSVLPLFPKDAIYYYTKASVPRALDEKKLEAEAAKFGLEGASYANVCLALTAARNRAGKDDIIFVGGSTFVVADAIK